MPYISLVVKFQVFRFCRFGSAPGVHTLVSFIVVLNIVIQNHDILSLGITYIFDSKRFNFSIYFKIHVIFVRNIQTMLSIFNLIFFPKLHCSNKNHVKKLSAYFHHYYLLLC